MSTPCSFVFSFSWLEIVFVYYSFRFVLVLLYINLYYSFFHCLVLLLFLLKVLYCYFLITLFCIVVSTSSLPDAVIMHSHVITRILTLIVWMYTCAAAVSSVPINLQDYLTRGTMYLPTRDRYPFGNLHYWYRRSLHV